MSWKVRGTIKTNNEGHVNIYQASIFEDQNRHPPQIIADDLNQPGVKMAWSVHEIPADLDGGGWLVKGAIKTKNEDRVNVYQASIIPDSTTEDQPFIQKKETAQRIADDLNKSDAEMMWSVHEIPADLETESLL